MRSTNLKYAYINSDLPAIRSIEPFRAAYIMLRYRCYFQRRRYRMRVFRGSTFLCEPRTTRMLHISCTTRTCRISNFSIVPFKRASGVGPISSIEALLFLSPACWILSVLLNQNIHIGTANSNLQAIRDTKQTLRLHACIDGGLNFAKNKNGDSQSLRNARWFHSLFNAK